MDTPVYSQTDMSTLPKGLYIGLFHGRDSIDSQMNDWGYDGPVIGPLKWWHTTYGDHSRGEFVEGFGREYVEAKIAEGNSFKMSSNGWESEVFQAEYTLGLLPKEGLVLCAGKYYGDWSVFYNDEGY